MNQLSTWTPRLVNNLNKQGWPAGPCSALPQSGSGTKAIEEMNISLSSPSTPPPFHQMNLQTFWQMIRKMSAGLGDRSIHPTTVLKKISFHEDHVRPHLPGPHFGEILHVSLYLYLPVSLIEPPTIDLQPQTRPGQLQELSHFGI